MGARAPTQFVLTRKGVDELARRTYRLDARIRNILFLIQKGVPTVEGILENTIFPQDEVVERLQRLLRDEFVALDGAAPGPESRRPEHPAPAPPAPPLDPVPSDFPMLDSGISVSQARFILGDFCLDQFGTKGKPLIESLSDASDVDGLQQVLHRITREVRKHRRAAMPALLACVREVNELAASPASRLRAAASG